MYTSLTLAKVKETPRGALFSDDRVYRYLLWRQLTLDDALPGRAIMFVGLNPSTADEYADDPTIRRCKRFAAEWGYAWLIMANLYALRSTDPTGLKRIAEPRGEKAVGFPDHNRLVIRFMAREVDAVVAAWGAYPGPIDARPATIYDELRSGGKNVLALGLTAKGAPRHPLYMKANSKPIVLARPT